MDTNRLGAVLGMMVLTLRKSRIDSFAFGTQPMCSRTKSPRCLYRSIARRKHDVRTGSLWHADLHLEPVRPTRPRHANIAFHCREHAARMVEVRELRSDAEAREAGLERIDAEHLGRELIHRAWRRTRGRGWPSGRSSPIASWRRAPACARSGRASAPAPDRNGRRGKERGRRSGCRRCWRGRSGASRVEWSPRGTIGGAAVNTRRCRIGDPLDHRRPTLARRHAPQNRGAVGVL